MAKDIAAILQQSIKDADKKADQEFSSMSDKQRRVQKLKEEIEQLLEEIDRHRQNYQETLVGKRALQGILER